MKLKLKVLVTQFLPSISQLGGLQRSGHSGLSQKAGYAIAKNFNMAIDLIKDYEEEKKSLIELYVKKDDSGYMTEARENGMLDYVFNTPDDKTAYLKALEEKLSTEVDFKPFKFSVDEFETCHNIPVDIIALLEQMQIITEVSLSTSPLKMIN